jgi:hypothetical protein
MRIKRKLVTNSTGYQTLNIPKIISDYGWDSVSACELEYNEIKNIIIDGFVCIASDCNSLPDPCRRDNLMRFFDEPIMIDGKEVGCKPPKNEDLIDLEKLCP